MRSIRVLHAMDTGSPHEIHTVIARPLFAMTDPSAISNSGTAFAATYSTA